MHDAVDHDELAQALGAYALDALPREEHERLRRHLTACEVCRDELAALTIAVDALPRAVPPVVAPAALGDRVMAVVRAEAELLQAAGPEADVVARSPAPRRRWLALGGLALNRGAALAAVVGLLVLGGVLGFLLRGDGGGATRTIRASVDATVAPSGSAQVVVRGSTATLRVDRMPQAPEGRVYQVWIARRGVRVPLPTDALFTVDERGDATVAVPHELDAGDRVLVTDEPRGGSRVPTRQPVIAARTSV